MSKRSAGIAIDRSGRAVQAEEVGPILESADAGIVAVDPEGRCTFANPAAARSLGYDVEELVGAPLHELVHDRREDGSAYPRDCCPTIRSLTEGRSIRVTDDVMWHRDGRPVPVEYTTSPIWQGEAVGGAVVVFHDVSEQRRARDRMQSQLAMLAEQADLLELTHVSIIVRTIEGEILYWNTGAERMYGWAKDEVIGRPAAELLRTELPVPLEDVVATLRTSGQWEGELRQRTRDGRALVTASQWSLRPGGAGRPDAILEITVDKTAAAAAEAKFRGLLEGAPDAIVGVDDRGRIVLVNAQAEEMFGYGRDELIGQPVEVLVPEADRRLHAEHRVTYFREPRTRPMGAGMELSARRRDGSTFPAEISLSAIHTDAGILVSASVRDVTERLEAQAARERLTHEAERARLESQLRQTQRLESLGQLAGGVAHDFNNLLAVILNYSAFVAEEVEREGRTDGGERWEAVRRDVEQIQRAAARATGLTHQLLAFGRRELVRPQVLDVNERVRETEQMLRRTIGEHIELETSLMPGLWNVFADPGQIDQVLVNLAVNARDAMPQGGTLRIDTENVVVDEEYARQHPGMTPGDHVRLRVSDSGVGIPREIVDRVFEPFFTTKPKGQGTGLGLATVYGIIAQAGGHTKIYSEPGIGTAVTALLPAAHDVVAPIAGDERVSRGGGGETILVVEDEEAMREVTRRILTRNGYRVLEAPTAAGAVALAAEHAGEIDLLLTDVVMPQMLGKEVAQRVETIQRGVRVLYMSGYAQPVLASQGTLDEGVRLIEKPFSEKVLLERVRNVLDEPA